jgi:hypothetical protein
MIDTIYLENNSGKTFRLSDYGLLLASFDAPEPKTKLYRVSIDGADGDIDMTEWAGVVRYDTRNVTVKVRDMSDKYWRNLVDFCHGREIKLYHSGSPEYYYSGRFDASHSTRSRVTDVALTGTCFPYRLATHKTVVSRTIQSSANIILQAARMPVCPFITAENSMTISFDGKVYTVEGEKKQIEGLILTDTPLTLTVTGSGQITFSWQDGVI